MAKNYWLVKSEPSTFSIEDLMNSKNKTTHWDGVRNYQARNFMRDDMKKGDEVLFYYSGSDPKCVVGVCKVVKDGYADHTQFDPDNKHYFPSADPKKPIWYMVDIKFKNKFKKRVTLEEIKNNSQLKDMRLIQKGNRLSVMPVTRKEFDEVVKMGSK